MSRSAWLAFFIWSVAVFSAPSARADTLAWAEAQISKPGSDGVVDFDRQPGCSFDPKVGLQNDYVPEAIWPTPRCDTLSAQEFQTILKKAANIGILTITNFYLKPSYSFDSKHPVTSTDLSRNNVKERLVIGNAVFVGNINIDESEFTSLDIENSYFAGALTAENLQIDGAFKFNNVHFYDLLDMRSLNVKSYVSFFNLYGLASVRAKNMHVGGYFYIGDHFQMKYADFSNSILERNFEFERANVAGPLNCQSCVVGGDLHFDESTNLHDLIDFTGAHIQGSVVMSGPGLRLTQVYLRDAVIEKRLDLSDLNQTSWTADVTACDVGGDFTSLDLTNSQAGAFTDAEGSWPPLRTRDCEGHVSQIGGFKIDGFRYGSIQAPYEQNCPGEIGSMSRQPQIFAASWFGFLTYAQSWWDYLFGPSAESAGWIEWLGENRGSVAGYFDPQPYDELAAVFKAEGLQEPANALLLRSEKRKMYDQWSNGAIGPALLSGFLWIVAGFGIAGYAFWHLLSTIIVSILVGVYYVKNSAKARHLGHGYVWCVGAALERLLPIIELREEFKDFFEKEPDGVEPLTEFEKSLFDVYSLWGWLLGLLFVTSITGLTEGY